MSPQPCGDIPEESGPACRPVRDPRRSAFRSVWGGKLHDPVCPPHLQTGTRPEKIRIQKWYTIYKDHITLADYEVHDGMGLELYYN